MERKIVLVLAVLLSSSLLLNAAAYKGQRVYAKHCVSCHGRQPFIQSKTKKEWEKILEARGKNLAQLHTKDEKAKPSWEYFKSKKYNKKVKHLRDFFVEYAKDSGKVPACN